MIDYPKVYFFCELAECLNFTEAAARLYMTQSSLSKAIANFEEGIHCKLFVRSNRTVELTPAGKYLYDYFKKHLPDMREAMKTAQAYNESMAGVLSVAAFANTFFMDDILDALSAFREAVPYVHLNFLSPNLKESRDGLIGNKFDLLVTHEREVAALSSCDWLPIAPSQTVAYISRKHPILKTNPAPTLQDLKDCTFVTMLESISNRMYSNMFQACRANGFVPENVKYASRIAEMHMEVLINNCVGVLERYECGIQDKVVILPIENAEPGHIVFAWNLVNNNPLLPTFIRYMRTARETGDK